jgi:hypothetical protein
MHAPRLRGPLLTLLLAVSTVGVGGASGEESTKSGSTATTAPPVEEIRVTGRRPVTATATMTIPADRFDLMPLESGGQMLEAVPNLVTAQHTGGGKAEQYFIRGFDADHGTDLAVYFDGVPVNLRSHAHGQGFLDLHFVTKETIAELQAYKGPYFARYGDFATAAAVEYVPVDAFEESFVKVEGGELATFRAVAGVSPRSGVFSETGPADGLLSFEAYHSDGPFLNEENLWRYSVLARGGVDLSPAWRLSGHLLGYHASWYASGLIPENLVETGALSRWGSLDPSEGGSSSRVQGKAQVDWRPTGDRHLMMNAYVAWYDLELFSNFTYFLANDQPFGDGIVQRDDGRIYAGGRIEYTEALHVFGRPQLRAGLEGRYDEAEVLLGSQTKRLFTGCVQGAPGGASPCAFDSIDELSLEPWVDVQIAPLPWMHVDAGLRFAWFRFDGRDLVSGASAPPTNETLWLPKANLVVSPFSEESLLPVSTRALRDLDIYVNFGIGYHSNDARAVFAGPTASVLPEALGTEVGLRTWLCDRVEIAVDWWYLSLEDEFVFVGDEGTTESAGETTRQGIELVATIWALDWLYVRGDVGYTSARIDANDRPVPQAPRLVARAATGVRYEGFAGEIAVRHLGDRYASEDFYHPRLSGYTVLDLGLRYRWRFLEVGLAVENLTDTAWRSSEFHYTSRPVPASLGGTASDDFHFTPGNPRNVRAWLSAYF